MNKYKSITAVGGLFLCGATALALSVADQMSPIYAGPVPVEGVKRVEVNREHHVGFGFQTITYQGNTVDIELTNGSKVSIRDYDGDFELDPEDSVQGTVPRGIEISDVLEETLKKAGHVSNISYF